MQGNAPIQSNFCVLNSLEPYLFFPHLVLKNAVRLARTRDRKNRASGFHINFDRFSQTSLGIQKRRICVRSCRTEPRPTVEVPATWFVSLRLLLDNRARALEPRNPMA